ncbi:MAG: hypothetical protein ACHP9Y_03625, partial [Gammaproteobacteria bacterium]
MPVLQSSRHIRNQTLSNQHLLHTITITAPEPRVIQNSLTVPPPEILRAGIKYQTLAAQVYHDQDDGVPADWEVLGDLNHPMGWRARAYKDNTGKVSVSFRGSATAKEFLVLDAGIALAMIPSLADIDPWLNNLGVNNLQDVVFVGHSLGATLATAKSVAVGGEAYVFDSPGLPGYSQDELSRVYDFESADNIVNDLPYEKAGTGQRYKIPLPPNVVQDIAIRKSYSEQLNAFYFVQNDVTRAINAAYLLVSNVENLMDIHSVSTIGQSMQNMSAGLQQQLSLQDPRYDTASQSGPYAIQMTYQVQSAIDYTNKLAKSARSASPTNQSPTEAENLFEAERKATLQALEDAQTSLNVYQSNYNPDAEETAHISEMRNKLSELQTFSKTASKEDFVDQQQVIANFTRQIKTEIDATASSVTKAVEYLKKPENRKYTLDLGYEILAGFGVKVSEEDKETWNASVAMLVTLSSDFNTYRIESKKYAHDSQFMCIEGPTPGEAFLSSSLENLQGFFNEMASIGSAFGRPEISQIATIGGSAVTIALQIGRMTGFVAGAFTPLGAIASIATASVSLFSALSGKAKAQQEQAEALQNALKQISQQIAALHQEMRASFDQVFKNQQAILEYVSNAFAAIDKNFITTFDMLNSIEQALRELEEQLNNQAVSAGLREFNAVTSTSTSIQQDHYAPSSREEATEAELVVERQAVLRNADNLIFWLNGGAASNDFTGGNFPLSSDPNTALINLNRRIRTSRYEFVVAHLVHYLQVFYPQSELGKYANSDVLNVTMWSSAVSYYAGVLRHNPAILEGYALDVLEDFQDKGMRLLQLITDLRKNDPFIDALFEDFEEDITRMMVQFKNFYYANAKLEFVPTTENGLSLTSFVNKDPTITNNQELAVARNQLINSIGMLAGGFPTFELANAYATQKQKRLYELHEHFTDLLSAKPNQVLTRYCLIDNVPHLAVFYCHTLTNSSGQTLGRLAIEFFNLDTKKWLSPQVMQYDPYPSNLMTWFNLEDVVITTSTSPEGVRNSNHFQMVGRIVTSNQNILTAVSFNRINNTWGIVWDTKHKYLEPMESARLYSYLSDQNILTIMMLQPKRYSGSDCNLPVLIRPVAPENYIFQELLPMGSASHPTSYSHFTCSIQNNVAWFIVASKPVEHHSLVWQLYFIPDLTQPTVQVIRANLNPNAAPLFAYDNVFISSVAVRMEIVNSKPYILFACSKYGLRLYSYDPNAGWGLLLDLQEILNSNLGWQDNAYRSTLTMKKSTWKQPADKTHEGLIITARSSRGEHVWVYSITDKTLLKTNVDRAEYDSTLNAVTPHVLMLGPEWSDARGYRDNPGGTTSVEV